MAIGRITGQMLSSTLNRNTTDLKFATDGDSNLLVLDATNDRIGVGVASPTVQFETSGSAIIGTDLTVTGNLTVNGSTTTINTTNLTVDDKNIELAHSLSGQAPTDAAADGGGIILKGDTDHTILWSNANNSWDFSEHVNVSSGNAFKINNATVLDANNLTLENIQIAGNVITSASNADISLQPSGTGKVVIEGIQIDGTVITGVDSTVISFGGNQLSGVADPTQPSDVSTKSYVDSQVSAISSTLGFSDSSSNTGSVVVGTNDLEFRSGDSLTLTVAGNGVTASLNDNITVNQIGAKDSTAVSITSPLQVTGALQTSSSLQIAGSTVITAILDEDNMVSDSASAIPTQQSVKAYVDSQITATNSLTLGDDASSEITLNLDDVLNVKGGNSVTSSVAGDSLTFGLDANITVNQIGALDSTAVSITSPLQATSIQSSGNVDVNGTFTIGTGSGVTTILDEDNMASNSATALATQQSIKAYVDSVAGGTITLGDSASNAGSVNINAGQDLEFRSGDSITMTVSGNGVTSSLNDNITVNQIGAKDSTAVSITSNTQVDGTLQVSGASTLVGNVSSSGSVTAGTSFIIGGADLNETDLEKLDGITDGTGAANKALVLDASQDITSGVNVFTATTGDFQTVKVNTIESDDSTAVTVNDGLQVNGNFGFNEGVTVTQILDEDNFASNSATALATQQSIKAYVDAVAQGLHVHASVHALTNTPLATITGDTVTYDNGSSGVGATLTLNTALDLGGGDIDGDTDLQVGDRIIINGESTAAHNGIYVITSTTVLTRATDFDTSVEMAGGDFVFVTHGTLYADTGWVLGEPVTTVGSDAVDFIQFSGAGAFTAGDGLTLTGTEFSVNVDSSTIEINADTLRVKDAGITNVKLAKSTITVVGDDSTGTSVSLGETFKIAGGDSLNASVTADTLTINLDDDITVNQIGAKDSTAVSVTSPLQTTSIQSSGNVNVNGTFTLGTGSGVTTILDEDNMASNSATALATQQSIKAYVDSVAGGTITLGDSASNAGSVNINEGQDLEFRSGDSLTLTVSGNGVTASLNDNITVNQIGAKDSTAVSITSPLQVTGALQTSTSLQIAGSTTITSILDEDNMASDSATALATQQSIKAYVDSQITASNTLTLGDDASSEISLNLDDVLNVKGGNSITSSVAGDSLTFGLDANITVNQIGALDSTAVSITSPLQATSIQTSGNVDVNGSATIGSVQISGNVITSTDSTQLNFGQMQLTDVADPTQASDVATKSYVDSQTSSIVTTIGISDSASNSSTLTLGVNDLEFRSGDSITPAVAGTGVTFNLNDNITVNQIGAKDSTAVSITSATQIDGTLQVSGASTLNGDITIASGSITSASGSISFGNENLSTTGNITGVDIQATGNLQVDGNLTVSGTTTSVNSTNITVSDPMLILSETNSGGADVDSGIMIERGSAGNNAVFYWNEGDDRFKAVLSTSDGTTTSVSDDSYATVNLGGLVMGAESVVITSILDEDNMASNSATALATQQSIKAYVDSVAGGTITLGDSASNAGSVNINAGQDLEFRSGDSLTLTVAGNGVTAALNDNITVNQIGAKDSTAVSITSPLQVTGDVQSSGDIKAGTSFTIGAASLTEAELEKLDEITNGTGAANKALVLDASQDITSGVNVFTATTGDFQTVKVNTIESDDSTAVTINDGLIVTGNFEFDGGVAVNTILDEDNMASDSATALATQQSIKAYVDSQVAASNSLTLGDDASSEITLNLDDVLNVKGGNSITSSVAGDSLTFALDSNITVNQIGALDSTAINITSPVYVTGALNTDTSLQIAGSVLIDGILDEDNMASNSATKLATQQSIKAYVDSVAGGTITLGDSASNAGSVDINGNQDLEFRSGDSITMTVSGNGVTSSLNDNITVNQIGAKDSTAISLTSNTQVDGTLQVSGTSALVGNVTMSGTFTAATGSSVGNLTLANGSITDSSGAISFDNENLSTTGTITGATGSQFGNITLANGSITDSSGTITFDNENLTTTGNITGADIQATGNLQVDGNLTVSGTTTSVNSTNITVSDPMLILSETNSGGADVDSGIMVERGSAGNNAAFYWNEGDDRFKAVLTTSDGTTTSVTDSSYATLNIGGLVMGAESVVISSILDEDNMASDSATALATQQSIKAYVDTSIGAISSTLGFSDSSSNTGSVVVGTNDIEFRSGDSLTLTVAGNGVTASLNDNITVNQIGAKDSTAVSITSPLQTTSIQSSGAVTVNGTFTLGTGSGVTTILDEDNLASNSDTALATQQSIKAYVDSQVAASNSLTLGDDASSEITLNLDDVLNVKGGNSITSSVAGDSLTFALDANISVNQIGALDSTAINITSPVYVTGALNTDTSLQIAGSTVIDGILDEDNFASNSATKLATQQSIKAYVDSVAGGTIKLGDSASNSGTVDINGNQDLEFRSGDSITMTVSGNGVTASLNDNITVNQIGAKDSSAITIENNTYINGDFLYVNGLAVDTIGSRDSVGIDFLGTRLQNIGNPVAAFDAATKDYVDVSVPNYLNDLLDVDADGADILPGDVLMASTGDSTATVMTLSHNLTGAMRLPSGNTSERPSIYSGIIRYNTETGKYEGSTDGSTWNAFAMEGTAETLNKDVFTGDGGATYNFSNVTTPLAGSGSNGATGLIVYIDNVLQEPTQNYTITNTAITFDSAVHSGARIVVIQGFDGGAGGGASAGLTTTENTDVDSATETLDSWALATYRAAKYTYRIENADTSEYQAGEILVVHDGSASYFTEYAKVLTGNNDLITFSVGVGGGNVILYGSANTPNSNFRAKRINLEVA